MTPQQDTAWAQVSNHFQNIRSLQSVIELVSWDQQAMMPPNAAEQRASQMGYLDGHLHTLQTDPQYIESLRLLSSAGGDLPAPVRRAVTVMLKRATRQTRLSPALVNAISVTQSRAYEAWITARKSKDFNAFAPNLKALIKLKREEGDCLATNGKGAYETLLDDFEPEAPLSTIEQLLSSLKQHLVPLVGRIREHQAHWQGHEAAFAAPHATQVAVNHSMLEKMGFDFSRGRLDTSAHPFCGGSGADIRLTTRYDLDDWTKSFLGIVHEGGHGLFEQGMDAHVTANALRDAPSYGMHESQSRFWENHIGRSYTFCNWLVPTLTTQTPGIIGVSPEALYRKVNQVVADPVRVDADEVTYSLHIFIRFRIEKRLFSGDLSVEDLPAAWNEGYAEMLGITPADDGVGVLQDMHWSSGAFAYFPSYTLGDLIAAQLAETFSKKHDLDRLIADGEFLTIRNWLNQHVHALGNTKNTLDIVHEVTGSELSHAPFIRYLERKFLA